MKRNSFFLSVLLLSLFAACVKGPIPPYRPDPAQRCPIVNLTAIDPSHGPYPPDEYFIYYNAAGNPDSFLLVSSQLITQLNYYFHYDRYGRLIGFIQSYALSHRPGFTSTALLWDVYTYVSRNTIVDSFFEYGGTPVTASHPAPDMQFARGSIITLDDKGRIIKVQDINGPSFTSFQYDARGNMIRSGVTYDNNVNPYRTSPIWQFVFNDFSRNNPSESFYGGPENITAFNAERLPLSISSPNYLFGAVWNNGLTFTYACDIGHSAP